MTSEVAAALKPNVSSSGQKSRLAQQEWEYLDPLSDRRWDELAASHPDCDIFHSAGWAKVLCKTYRHKPFYLHLSQGGDTMALVPLMEVASLLTGRRGVCLPFSDFCAPLLFGESVQSSVVSKLSQLAITRNWKFLEVRSTTKPSASAAPSATFYSHKIDLGHDVDHLFARFKSPVRRAIRRALRSGVTAEITSSRESLSAFYELHVRTRRRHGLPPQPRKFFENIHEELIKNGLGFVALARSASQPIAAAVFLRFDKKALYKYAASDERYQELRGNDLVMWEGINFLLQEGAQTLHLGRTSIENDGLRRFKAGWNVTEEILYYFRFDVSRNSWLNMYGLPRAATSHKHVFGRLPLKLNQLAGSMIYPHLD
jgi:GNAT acetyltransferase-like protein